jgi:hypothetical protein
LTHANICFASKNVEKARFLYAEVMQMAEVAQNEAADITAIAKLRLAEAMPNEQLADAQ